MINQVLPVGFLAANCYIIGCENTRAAVVVDPGGDAQRILSKVTELDLKVKYIINTHGHIDHIAGNDELRTFTGAKLVIHQLDADMLNNPNANLSAFMGGMFTFRAADQMLEDGDVLQVGDLKLDILHTPGHSQGGICVKCGEHLWTGDTLFNQGIGRTDFPGGDYKTLIESIKTKLMTLPDDVAIYPGHGPASTIGSEKRQNSFL